MSRLIRFAKGVVRPLVAQQSNIIFKTAAPSFTFQFKSFSGEAGKDEVIRLFRSHEPYFSIHIFLSLSFLYIIFIKLQIALYISYSHFWTLKMLLIASLK
jgi:hypothetical protein